MKLEVGEWSWGGPCYLMLGRLFYNCCVFDIWAPNTSRYPVSGKDLYQEQCTTANWHERKHHRGKKCAEGEMRPVIQNPPLTQRTPMFIIDQRFAGRKREKSYVCDNCQLAVPHSSVKRFFRNRYLSYINHYLSYISAKRKPTMLISFEWAK